MIWVKTLLLVFITNIELSVADSACNAILHPSYASCAKSGHISHAASKCLNEKLCGHGSDMTYIDIEPFTYILKNVMSTMVQVCCGGCTVPSQYPNKTINAKSMTFSDINNSTFVFPVFGRASEENIYGYHFIPVLSLSSGYFITRKISTTAVMMRLVNSCANLWPLLVIMLLLAAIAGFPVWLMETITMCGSNKEEFGRPFYFGLFDGFWWAFVSMTTVGYGDKTPRFFISRLYSVLWILIGITICAMFTAALTTEIDSAFNPVDPELRGKHVGILKDRAFDASFIAHHGGLIKEVENISELKNLLFKKDSGIDGIFMDKFSYMYSVRNAKSIDDDHPHSEAVEFFLDNTFKVKEIHDGEKMSYGILIEDEAYYKFYKNLLEHNQDIFESCAILELNQMEEEEEEEHNLFSTDGGYFYPFLYATLAILGAIVIIGICYEILRHKRKNPKVESES